MNLKYSNAIIDKISSRYHLVYDVCVTTHDFNYELEKKIQDYFKA